MKRIGLLLQDSLYNEYLQRNVLEEMEHQFCRHDINHLFAVAQMTFSLMLNNNDGEIFLEETGTDSQAAAKEVIYAAGLLHDIGKWKEYRDGEDSAACSARLSRAILPRALFTPDEIAIICRAIGEQRNISKDMSLLGEKLYRGNNLARINSECRCNEECPRAGNREISTGAAEY